MAVAITRTADPASSTATIVSNTATYTAQSIGTASQERIVAVTVACTGSGVTVVSATIDLGGGAEPMALPQAAKFGATVGSGIFIKQVPAGTSATIAVTFGGAPTTTTHHISVYSITGGSGTLSGGGTNTSTDMDSSSPLTLAVVVPSSGGILAVASCTADTVAKTWAPGVAPGPGVAKDLDADGGTFRYTTASGTQNGSYTLTCTGTTNNEDGALSVVIFGPLTDPGGTQYKEEFRSVLPPYGRRIPADQLSQSLSGLSLNRFFRIFRYDDWQNPRGPVFPVDLRSWFNPVINVVTQYMPGVVTQWDLPVAASRTILEHPQQLIRSTAAPFYQDDWPNPIGPIGSIQLRTWLNRSTAIPFFDFANMPGAVTQWDLPIAAPRGNQDYLYSISLALTAPPAIPNNQFDWPVPKGAIPSVDLRTWTHSPFTQSAFPLNNYDWPNPKGARRSNPDQQYSFGLGFTTLPNNQFDWPNPKGAIPATDLRTWTHSPFTQSAVPFNTYDWPNPLTARQPVRFDYPYNTALLTVIGTPFAQYDWPVPAGKVPAIDLKTWINPSTVIPFFDFANMPAMVSLWDVPQGPQRGQDWQYSTTLLTTPTTKPFHQDEWIVPLGKARSVDLLTTINGIAQITYVFRGPLITRRAVIPTQQPDQLPNIALYVDTTKPFHQDDWPVPLGAKPNFNLNWQTTPQIAAETFMPAQVSDWGNPTVPIQLNQSWTVLPQITQVATPFVQTEWPNPVVTSIHQRGFTEGPQPQPQAFSQPDWPNPGIPQYPISLRTWTSSTIDLRNTNVKKPFNQYDWPNPKGYKQPIDLLTQAPFPFKPVVPPVVITARFFPFIANVGTLMQRS